VVVLNPGRCIESRLVAGEQPLAGETVVLVHDWSGAFGGFWRGHVPDLRLATTDERGAFRFASCGNAPWRLYAVLSPGLLSRLGVAVFPPAELARVRLSARANDGTPVSGAAFRFFLCADLDRTDQQVWIDPLLEPVGDRRGEAHVLVAEPQNLRVCAWTDELAGVARLQPGEGGSPVTLHPPRVLAGTVKDSSGKPQRLVVHVPAPRATRFDHPALALPSILGQRYAAPTDAEGAFSIWLAGDDDSVELQFLGEVLFRSQAVRLTGARTTVDLVVDR
jgi:hypothetical protein